ncbi:MAG TPA: hypothetical protein VH230_04830 [Stellaceae bacterium]|nr:hypothetical protein [Stellaceae bacterium]
MNVGLDAAVPAINPQAGTSVTPAIGDKPPTPETALFAAAGTKPGQKHAGIDNQKQKPVILYLAARDCRAGEEAQGLNRKGEPIASMSAKIGDTAPCRGASVDGGVPGCV